MTRKNFYPFNKSSEILWWVVFYKSLHVFFRCASISWFEVVSNWVSHLPFSASASTGLIELVSFNLTLSSLHDPPGLLGSNTGAANTRLRSSGGEGARGWRNLTNQDLLCWNCFAFFRRTFLCFFMFVQSHYFENPIHLHNLWTAIQEDYFLAVQQFLQQGVPKKVYNRMLLELQSTG